RLAEDLLDGAIEFLVVFGFLVRGFSAVGGEGLRYHQQHQRNVNEIADPVHKTADHTRILAPVGRAFLHELAASRLSRPAQITIERCVLPSAGSFVPARLTSVRARSSWASSTSRPTRFRMADSSLIRNPPSHMHCKCSTKAPTSSTSEANPPAQPRAYCPTTPAASPSSPKTKNSAESCPSSKAF